jgi:hypothetical protein
LGGCGRTRVTSSPRRRPPSLARGFGKCLSSAYGWFARRSYTCAVCGQRQLGIGPATPAHAWPLTCFQETTMSLGAILLIVVILMLVGAFPAWPHSRSWGYAPTGVVGVVLLILVVLLLMGRL